MEEREFILVGGHLALDYINTEHIGEADQRVDRLREPVDVLHWARQVGLPVASDAPALRRMDVRVRGLRVSLRRLVEASIDGAKPDPEALASVRDLAAAPLAGAELQYVRGGYTLAPVALRDPMDVVRVVARQGAQLLASPEIQRVRRCGSDRCVLIFLDRSKAGKRKWCSMELCGNRAKVAAHHRRERCRGD